MLSSNLIYLSFICFACNLSSVFFILPFLKKYVNQKPNKRSSHISSKTSGGGITFVIFITFFSALIGNYTPLFCLPLAVVGFIDDLKQLPSFGRYIFQFLTVFVLIYRSEITYTIYENFSDFQFSLIFSFLLILGTAILNFVNFMDGIDGLVSGSMIIIFFLGSFLISNDYFILSSALCGFLFWNWHPSKVFMGDVGSTFIGALLFNMILNSQDWNNFLAIFIVSFPLLGDAFFTVIRRFLNKQNIFNAHSLHLYQRLYKAGWSHASVSILYIFFIVLLSITIMIGDLKIAFSLLTMEFFIGFWLDQNIAIPFIHSEKG